MSKLEGRGTVQHRMYVCGLAGLPVANGKLERSGTIEHEL